jgi:hypothetical protein
MENAYPVIEFEAEVTEHGTLAVPRSVARTLAPGTTVTVRLTHGTVASALRRRGVTEDEVERIASRQLEPRENVLRFLETEGALSSGARFGRRGPAGKA